MSLFSTARSSAASELSVRANTPNLSHVGVAGVQGEGVPTEEEVDTRDSIRRSDAPGGNVAAGVEIELALRAEKRRESIGFPANNTGERRKSD